MVAKWLGPFQGAAQAQTGDGFNPDSRRRTPVRDSIPFRLVQRQTGEEKLRGIKAAHEDETVLRGSGTVYVGQEYTLLTDAVSGWAGIWVGG